jgi:hypothetical protein
LRSREESKAGVERNASEQKETGAGYAAEEFQPCAQPAAGVLEKEIGMFGRRFEQGEQEHESLAQLMTRCEESAGGVERPEQRRISTHEEYQRVAPGRIKAGRCERPRISLNDRLGWVLTYQVPAEDPRVGTLLHIAHDTPVPTRPWIMRGGVKIERPIIT